MNQNLNIDQRLQVALQAGKKNNVFIYHAPVATVSEAPKEKYDGAIQMLYASCWELLDQGVKLRDWWGIAKQLFIQAAIDKTQNKKEAAELLGIHSQNINRTIKRLDTNSQFANSEYNKEIL